MAVALLTAACGSATISGSQVKSVSNSGNVPVGVGANAGTTVAAGAEDAPRNPTVHKSPQPVPQSQPPTPNTAGSSTTVPDRCTDGSGASGVGSRAAGFGKQPPLPACMPE